MGFLLLSISCAVVMAMLLKISENAGMNSLLLITANYVSGSVVGWALIAADGGTTFSATTLWLGIAGGFLWPLPFFILTRTIRALGVAIAAPLARFGMIVPILFGLLFLGEGLSIVAFVGLMGAFAAILLISPIDQQSVQRVDRQSLWLIPLMILMIGLANLWINLFNTIADSAETNLFFTLVFSFSTLFCLAIIYFQRVPFHRPTVQRGFIIGIANFFYTYFLLGALRAPIFQDSSAVVYTVLNVTYIVLVFAAGALIWREAVTRRNVAGVGVAAVAMLLINFG